MEDDTALSIIDPLTLNMDINKNRVLEVIIFHLSSAKLYLIEENIFQIQLHLLTVRLSYHDMRMFLQILNSLPNQMVSTGKNESFDSVDGNTGTIN